MKWRDYRDFAAVFFALSGVCLVSFHIGDVFMVMAERGGSGDLGALLLGLLGTIVFKALSIPSFAYILVVLVLFPFAFAWGWLTHAAICGVIVAALYLPEGKNMLPLMLDKAARWWGFFLALVNPSTPMPKVPKDSELTQNRENIDLSVQLQSELNRIERLKAKLKDKENS